MKIPITYLFQNIFSDSPFPLTVFFFLATALTNILFYCFDIYQVQLQILLICNSSILLTYKNSADIKEPREGI